MKVLRAALLIGAATVWQAAAQGPVWDNSGNGLLNGNYYFREVIYVVGDDAGDLNEAVSVYGNISFDGNGNYSITGAQELDSSSGAGPFSTTGTYSIAASGYGFFTHPLSSTGHVYTVYGSVAANGVFIGSTTEQGFNDVFVAAKLASPQPTVASFQGTYNMVGFLPPSPPTYASPAYAADTSFTLNPDGAGNLGTVSVSGYYGSGGSTAITQTSAAVKYLFSNGGAKITFPTSNTAPFYSGDYFMYMSQDGNFVFGGSPNDFDLFVGVKAGASGAQQNFGGFYYEAGLDEDVSQLASQGYGNLDTFYGSFSANNGAIVGHERLLDVFNNAAQGVTYAASYPSAIPGTYSDSTNTIQYWVGNGGAIRVGYGIGPYMGLYVALQAPTQSPPPNSSGVFLNPAGVVNAASFAPFTAGISNGEFIVLYGSNLAPGNQTASSLPFPTSLNGVTVTVNGLKAPIYYVTPTQLAVIVPYGTTYSIAQIQVNNNGVLSNSVTEFVNSTTPGIFTLNATGLGYGAIEHAADGSVVTPAKPAQPGEFVSIFASGLGNVFPPNPEGTPGPTSTLSQATSAFNVYIGGVLACGPNSTTVSTCPYVGLAPYLAGLYQMNVPIPAGVTAGDNLVEIVGPDSDAYQAFIPVGSGTATAMAQPTTQSVARRRPSVRRASGFTPSGFTPFTGSFPSASNDRPAATAQRWRQ